MLIVISAETVYLTFPPGFDVRMLGAASLKWGMIRLQQVLMRGS